jgi:hypothetical protein
MAARIRKTLETAELNAHDIVRQRYELSKELQELHTDVTLLSETRLKPHESFFIENYHIYRTYCPGRKGRTAFAVRKGIPHNHVDLPPLRKVETTGSPDISEILLAALCKPASSAWFDSDIIELLTLRHKSILADDLNHKYIF